MSEQQGSCEQCLGNNCYASSCNFECKQHGSWCETIVMGRFIQGLSELLQKIKRLKWTHRQEGERLARFAQKYEVIETTPEMEAQGIEVGDYVTHIDGWFPNGWKDFAKRAKFLTNGTILRVVKKDGTDHIVTL
jgi:hypothetical protein